MIERLCMNFQSPQKCVLFLFCWKLEFCVLCEPKVCVFLVLLGARILCFPWDESVMFLFWWELGFCVLRELKVCAFPFCLELEFCALLKLKVYVIFVLLGVGILCSPWTKNLWCSCFARSWKYVFSLSWKCLLSLFFLWAEILCGFLDVVSLVVWSACWMWGKFKVCS